MFEPQAAAIESQTRHFVFRYRSAAHWIEVFRAFYGPLLKAFAPLEPAAQDALNSDLHALIAGEFGIGSGEKLDRSAAPLPAASFVHLPAGMAHFAWAKAESVVQINGVGPFDVTYLNPADDPRKQ